MEVYGSPGDSAAFVLLLAIGYVVKLSGMMNETR